MKERIRSAAKQVPPTLCEILFTNFNVWLNCKGEQVALLAKELAEQGISAGELQAFLSKCLSLKEKETNYLSGFLRFGGYVAFRFC